MITLPNIDGKIWDLEYHVIDMINYVVNGKPLTINLNSEGPDAKELGLYALLDNICNRYNYSKHQVTIITCNQLETHPEYCIKRKAPLYIESAQQFAKNFKFQQKTFDDKFKHFGLFIGRSNWLRLWLAGYLYNNYKNQTAMTFHYDPAKDFHRDHLGLDDLTKFKPELLPKISPIKLINKCPIIDQEVSSYPIITPAHFNISKVYHTFFLEIVCETYSKGTSFYPTEKLWRPIINRTPFIVQGPRNYVENIHRLGFKTFSNWFDESHSQDVYHYQPGAICSTIDRISMLSINELEGMYIDMKDTLDHNYQNLMSLTGAEIIKIFK